MARNVPLGTIVTNIRAEAGHSLNPALGRQMHDTIVNLLVAEQELLWDQYDWPHLRVFRYLPLQAGQRFYSPPQDLIIDRITKIDVRFGSQLLTLDHGITEADMTVFASDMGFRGWPVQKWQWAENEQIEVWPVPSTNGDTSLLGAAPGYPLLSPPPTTGGSLEGVLRIQGYRNLRTFAADADLCDLDDRMLALFVAAKLLDPINPQRAATKRREAQARFVKIRGNAVKRENLSLSGGADRMSAFRPPGPIRVAYRTTN